jgi:hypothetical protein
MNKTNRYVSYLLRLWRDTDTGPWRATLVEGQSGQTRSFADPARLFAFLQTQMETPPAGEAITRPDKTPAQVEAGPAGAGRPPEAVNA